MASNKFKNFLITSTITVYRFFTANRLFKEDEFNPDNIKSIAIFSTTALGDFMFNTPAIRAIKERYPLAKITLISSHKNKQLVQYSPWFNKVIYWDQKINDILHVIRHLYKSKPDVAVLLHSKSPYDILCATLAGVPFIFKDAYNSNDLLMRKWVTAMSESYPSRHLIERKLSLVGKMACSTNNINMQIPYAVKKVIRPHNKIIIGFQMGASEKVRQWPVEYFRQFATLLLSCREDIEIALIGSLKEKKLAKEFLKGFSEKDICRIKDYVGQHSLPELVECIAGFSMLITGDTGPLHLAIALNVKTISLFVTANPVHTGPLQDPNIHTVIKGCPIQVSENIEYPGQPMASIKPEIVASAIYKKIADAKKPCRNMP